ncbi:hypothetical protein SYJ56_10440 [Algoriphagus sp. D3-2-R+10]|uniref:hypothetical protein n=1 Tax=Algoriphagus aurantiacus TaxID=3103948 RepID=UPI002B3E564B|nr:hypothetical protein [Algoriphagus sp. D3-2-R+10]MEB2775725.1 hypothetical protein [Algoriphagus sp. D3-2-R+10]
MEIRFLTKEESNASRKKEFLALSGAERFMAFLALSRRINRLFPSKSSLRERTKDNFILERKK